MCNFKTIHLMPILTQFIQEFISSVVRNVFHYLGNAMVSKTVKEVKMNYIVVSLIEYTVSLYKPILHKLYTPHATIYSDTLDSLNRLIQTPFCNHSTTLLSIHYNTQPYF